MGLAQTIKFISTTQEIDSLLLSLDYKRIEPDFYLKKSEQFSIEIKLIQDGIYIHRSGDYFEELGLLVESLGNITDEIIISDYP